MLTVYSKVHVPGPGPADTSRSIPQSFKEEPRNGTVPKGPVMSWMAFICRVRCLASHRLRTRRWTTVCMFHYVLKLSSTVASRWLHVHCTHSSWRRMGAGQTDKRCNIHAGFVAPCISVNINRRDSPVRIKALVVNTIISRPVLKLKTDPEQATLTRHRFGHLQHGSSGQRAEIRMPAGS
jgi:hypothetical protein